MLPDIVTQHGGFISPTQGYELSVHQSIGSGKHELFFRYNHNTNVIFAGTEEECEQKMWDLIVSISNLLPQEEQARIVTLGPPVPPKDYEPTECNRCPNKRSRIKKLEKKIEVLEKHLAISREQWNSGLETVTDAIQLLDTSKPSAVPTIAYVSENVSMNMILAKQVDYSTLIDIEKDDEHGYVLVRTTADDLDGWNILVQEEMGARHILDVKFMGSADKGNRTNNVYYYRTGKEEFLKGDSIRVVPKTIATKRLAIQALKEI